MIAAVALAAAGPAARLVSRPAGVLHVYVGPTTPSGRFIPRAARAVCRAHTRRLEVAPVDGDQLALHRVCARCAVSLRQGKARETAQLHREQYRRRYAGLTGRHLVAALADAATPTEVDQAAHLSLLLYGVTGCRRPDPATGRSLHDHVTAARRRFQTTSAFDRLNGHVDAAHARRKADAAAERAGREQRIARLGIRNTR